MIAMRKRQEKASKLVLGTFSRVREKPSFNWFNIVN